MKLIHLLPILLVIGLSCLTSCQKEEIPSANSERTLFMYLPWSTNLTSYFYQNIEDMEDAISRRGLDKERVIVFLSTSSTEAELFEITVNNGTCTRQILKEYTRIYDRRRTHGHSERHGIICSRQNLLPDCGLPRHGMAARRPKQGTCHYETPLSLGVLTHSTDPLFRGTDSGIPDGGNHPRRESLQLRIENGIHPV
jgi:hypothetical protein